jgi:hypothetical protein
MLNEFQLGFARERLPMWTDWGVKDENTLIHSLGVTFLTAVGAKLGYASVSEVPAPKEGPYSYIEEGVRSDSVWFSKEKRNVMLIAEFERYDGKKSLEPKADTLLLAHHHWASPGAILLLAYWTIGLSDLPDHASLRSRIKNGFQRLGRVSVGGQPGAEVVFLHFLLQDAGGLLRLTNIIPRGVV